MKIAIITLGIYPNQTGGVQLHSYYHALGLARAGDEVVVLTKRDPHRPRLARLGDIRVESLGLDIPLVGTVVFLLDALVSLLRHRRHIDIVHVHFATYFLLPACLFRALTTTPFVASCHGYDIIFLRNSRLWRTLQRISFLAAARLTSTSRQVRGLLIEDYRVQAAKVSVVPNGTDPGEAKLVQLKSDTRNGKRNMVLVANLRPVKDPMTAIKAAEIATKSISNLSLVVVGGGPLLEPLKDYALQNHLEGLVMFRGELSHAETLRTIAKSEVLVLPSLSEGGNPLVLMEAMMLGIPVVATRVGGVNDVVTEGVSGFLVPTRSPVSLASRVVQILNEPALAARLSEGSRQRSREFSWEATVGTYRAIYASILDARARPSANVRPLEVMGELRGRGPELREQRSVAGFARA